MKLTLASNTATATFQVLWLSYFLWSCNPPQPKGIAAFETQDQQSLSSYWKHPLLATADSFQLARSLDSASLHYQIAADSFLQQENWELVVHCHNMITFNLLERDRNTEAEKRLVKTRELVQDQLDPHHPSSAAYTFTEALYLANTNYVDSALGRYKRAVGLFEKHHSKDILTMKAHNYHRLGDLYRYSLDNLARAEKLYLKALDIRERVYPDTHFDLMVSYYALSSLSRNIDDYKRAELYGINALRIAEALGGQMWLSQSLCYNLLANIKQEQATLSRDPQHFQQSLRYYRKAIILLETNGGSQDEISVYYNNLGAVFKNMEVYDSANFYLHKALSLKKQASTEDISDSFLNLGWNHTALGNLDSAKYYYELCLATRSALPGSQLYDLALVYNDMAEMYEAFDSLEQSLAYNIRTLRMMIPNFTNPLEYHYSTSDTILNAELAFLAIVNTAKVLSRRFQLNQKIADLEQALRLYQLADFLNDQNRNSRIHDESKLFLSNYYQADFERAIDASYILFRKTKNPVHLDQAFKFIEKDKYVLLFEALAKARLQNQLGVPDSIMERENQLMTLMAEYQQELDQLPDNPQKTEDLNIRILEANREMERLKSQMIQYFPQYYQIQYDSISRNLHSIQRSLQPATMLLEYFWGSTAIYALGVTKDTVIMTRIPNTEELNQNLQHYLRILSPTNNYQQRIDDFTPYTKSAYYLFTELFKPLLNAESIDKLIVIPDGPLAVMPVESLLTEKTSFETVDYRSLEYLLKRYQVQYAYSSNLLFQNTSVTRGKPSVLAFSHAGLSGSSKELETISHVMKAHTWQGELATEENFKDEAPGYSILHLAVHGEGDTESLLNSKLIFNASKETGEDGILNVYELYGMDLEAELAVLSACETGVGKQLQGEGVYSMARAFTYAGCPSVIMSLWKTDDVQSATIFAHFYKALKDGMSSNQALHQAKLNFLELQDEITAHPSGWAALVSIGESQWKNHTISATTILLSALVVIFLAMIGYRTWNSRTQQSSR